MKIFIGMPVSMLIERQTLQCIDALKKENFEFIFSVGKGSNLPIARNKLVKEAIKSGADYFLGIDSDITFGVDDFHKLLSMEANLVFGAFRSKMKRDEYEAGYYTQGYPGSSGIKLKADSTGLIKTDWSGTGFFLAKVKFLARVGSPWFRQPDVVLPNGEMDICGEDVGFCMKLNYLQEPILVNCDLKLGHIIREDEKRFMNKAIQ